MMMGFDARRLIVGTSLKLPLKLFHTPKPVVLRPILGITKGHLLSGQQIMSFFICANFKTTGFAERFQI